LGNNHPLRNWFFVDSTDLAAAVGMTAEDIGKFAYIEATAEAFELVDDTPTWVYRFGRDTQVHVQLSISAEVSDIITVSCQVLDALDVEVNQPFALTLWLTDTFAAPALAASAPDGGVTVVTGLEIVQYVEDLMIEVLTDETGLVELEITHNGAGNWYLCVKLPHGGIDISNPISFAA